MSVAEAIADMCVSRAHGSSALTRDIVLAGIRQDPKRLLARAAQRTLLGGRGSAPTPSRSWLPELAWRLAVLPPGRLLLASLSDASIPELRTYITSVLEQLEAIDGRAPDGLVSLRGLVESATWSSDSQPGARIEEAVLVALARAIVLRCARKSSTPLWLSPDNLFVARQEWDALRRAVLDGRVPAPVRLRYREVIRDDMYRVEAGERLVRHQLVVASLAAISLIANPDSLSRVAARSAGTFPRLQIETILDECPSLSSWLAGVLTDLATKAARHQPKLAGLKKDCLARLDRLARELSERSTHRTGGSLYTLLCGPAGAGQPSELADDLEVLVAQIDADIESDRAWCVYRRGVHMTPDFIEREVWPRIWYALRTAKEGASRFGTERRPRLMVFPELVTPRQKVSVLRRFAQRENVIIVAGVEYRSEDLWARNEVLIAVPSVERHPRARSRLHWVGKHRPMSKEWAFLRDKGLRFIGTPDFTVLDHQQLGPIGVAVCYDLYAVDTLTAFQRRVLHLVTSAHNKDLSTFDSLSEASMRLLLANVVVSNTGKYGGSLVMSPYHDAHRREVVRVRGPSVETVERVRVPVRSLREHQQAAKLDQWGKKYGSAGVKKPAAPSGPIFKDKPADWD